MQSGQRDRHGFTLLEVTVALMIVLILAAVTVPSLISTIEKKKVTDTADRLVELKNAVSGPKRGGFYDTLTTYPGKISELSQVITTTVGTSPNSCGTAFNSTQVGNWSSRGGPFIDTYIPTSGLPVPIGLVQNNLVRKPNSATSGTLAFRIFDVQPTVAAELDYVMDSSDGATAGSIQWVATATGTAGNVDISYLMVVANKC